MGIDDLCDTGLVLGLGIGISSWKPAVVVDFPAKQSTEPALTLSLSDQIKKAAAADVGHVYAQDSAASSLSSVKREREEMVEIERGSSRVSDEDDDGSNGRKKLRLTKAQSALLEESFKLRSTLNPKQKQDLARDLKLRPRQVEVWFQNRRARTKLKQTEIDCEFLKKCCESLTDENRRLQKELQELKSLKLHQPLYMQMPPATLTMCPSCERIGAAAATAAAENVAKTAFFNPFTNSSAAC